MSTQICTKCKKEKPATADFFAPYRSRSRGLRARSCKKFQSWCRACCGERQAVWHQENREEQNRKGREAYRADPEPKKLRARERSASIPRPQNAKRSRDYANANPRQRLKTLLHSNYRLPIEEYERLYDLQGGRCAICRGLPDQKRLVVDHDHATNMLRGLLCRGCNLALGHFKDRVDVLRGALAYLERHNTPSEEGGKVILFPRKARER